jgi:hypothetical protein
MTDNLDTENWEPIPDSIPEDPPEEMDTDGGPFGWKNKNNGKVIGITPNTSNLTEFDDWLVRGENSILDSAGTLEEAKDFAYKYMNRIESPSAMV